MEYPLDKGMVDFQGLNFEYQKVSDEILVQSLLDGTFQLATIPSSALPSLYNQGVKDLVIVYGWYKEPVINGSSVGQLFVNNDLGIYKPNDLIGKKIALDAPGTFNSLMIKEVLEKNYNVYLSDLEIIYNDLSQLLLINGKVDAAVVWSSFIWEQKDSDNFKSLFDYGEEFAQIYSTTPPLTLILAKREYYNEHKAEINKSIEILKSAHKIGNDNLKIIADYYSNEYDMNPEVFIAENKNTKMMFPIDENEKEALVSIWNIGQNAGYYNNLPNIEEFLP
jgi:ABC-type nitrate/sulfonate/bicarbonate transport system substrate-binding protein